MTTAERLVRSLCKSAEERVRLEFHREVKIAERRLKFTEMPTKIRQAALMLRHARKLRATAERIITTAGFHYHDYMDGPIEFSHRNSGASRTTVEAHRTRRLQQIDRLRTDTTIAVLGKSPEAARTALQALQAALDAL